VYRNKYHAAVVGLSIITGKDPTKATDYSKSLHRRPQEVFELQCQADAGYFAIYALGR
jgi:hypothetical protein